MDEFKTEAAGQNIDPNYVKIVGGVCKDLLGPAINLSDDQIQSYVNQLFTEQVIQEYENQILAVMKKRQENYPNEQNDREWLAFTNFVCSRRCKHEFYQEMTKGNL